MNKFKTFILILLTIIISGCEDNPIYGAKAKAWGELQCKSHEGLYEIKASRNVGMGRCSDGTFIMEDLSKFTHPTVKNYLPKKESNE